MAKEIELDAEEQERDDELEAAFAELAGSGAVRWTIYCTGPREKVGHVATWEDGFSIDRVAREFGAGEYKVRAIANDGKMMKGGSRTIKVSSNSAYEREKQRLAALPAATPPTPPQGASLGEIIGLITTQQNNQMQIFMASMKAQSDMMIALISRPQPTPVVPANPFDGPALVSLMSNMKDLIKPEGNGVDTLLKGLELGRSLDAPEGGEADFMTIAAKGLDVLNSAVKQNSNPRRLPARTKRVQVTQHPTPKPAPAPSQPKDAPAASAAPAGASTSTPPQTQTSNTKESTPMRKQMKQLEWTKQQLAALLVQAARDSDPELYAAVMLDNLPDYIEDDELLKKFSYDNAVSQLQVLDSRVGNYTEWFERFRTCVIEQLSADDEDDGDDEGDYGDDEGDDGDDAEELEGEGGEGGADD